MECGDQAKVSMNNLSRLIIADCQIAHGIMIPVYESAYLPSHQREGAIMPFAHKFLVSLALATSLVPSAHAATIAGSVTGPDGKPFMGAFVVAENPQTRMTVSVLSNAQGRYHIGNLPAATYMARAPARTPFASTNADWYGRAAVRRFRCS